jgi:hypothetical protein
MSSEGGLETLAVKSSCKHNAYTWTQYSHSQKEIPSTHNTPVYTQNIRGNGSAEIPSEYRPHFVGYSVLHDAPHKWSFRFIDRFLASSLMGFRPVPWISAMAIRPERNC